MAKTATSSCQAPNLWQRRIKASLCLASTSWMCLDSHVHCLLRCRSRPCLSGLSFTDRARDSTTPFQTVAGLSSLVAARERCLQSGCPSLVLFLSCTPDEGARACRRYFRHCKEGALLIPTRHPQHTVDTTTLIRLPPKNQSDKFIVRRSTQLSFRLAIRS